MGVRWAIREGILTEGDLVTGRPAHMLKRFAIAALLPCLLIGSDSAVPSKADSPPRSDGQQVVAGPPVSDPAQLPAQLPGTITPSVGVQASTSGSTPTP